MSRQINLTIDINSRKVTKYQDLVKIGDALSLSITCLDGSKNYDFTNKSVHVFLKKSDNTKVEQTLTISSNVVTCATLDSQASTKVGQVEGELVILDASNNAQITSSTFTWQVEGSISEEVLEESKDSIETLNNINDTINNYNLNKDKLATENVKATQNISDLTSQNQQAINNKNALEADITQAQSNSFATEITNARGSYANLKARLDANDSSLSDNTQKIAQLSNPNLLIDGDFQVWQRGTSFGGAGVYYVADRWKIDAGSGTNSITKQYDDTYKNFIRISTDQYANLWHQLEQADLDKIKGKKVTLSFYARKLSGNFASAKCRLYDVYLDGNTLTTVWEKYTITATIPINATALNLALVNFVTGQNGSVVVFDIAQVKLEIGDKATPFVPRLYAEELASCQRYFTTFNNLGNSWAVGAFLNGGGFKITLPIPSTLRYIPTRIVNTLGETQFYDDNGTWQTLSFANLYLIDGGIILNFNAPVANATTGKSYIVRYLPSLDSEIY